MKYIEKLLQGAEVEWKKLGEVTEYEQPTDYIVETNNYNPTHTTPVLTAGKTFILGYTNETNGIYKASESPVIIFDDFTTANKWVDFDFKVKSSAMKMITSKDEKEISLRFIYHWLNTLPCELIKGDHKRQWISVFCNKTIPIPPLHVQQEIVRILDKFTELETELEAKLETELELRKQQYAYRDQLLSPDKGLSEAEVEWKKLGEVCQFKNGFAFKSSLFKESGLPIIRIGNIIGNSISMRDMAFFDPKDYKKGKPLSYFISKGDILIAMSGATTGKIGYYDNEELAYLNQRVGKFIPNPITLNNRFLYHFLLTQSDYFYRLSLGGAQPNLSSDDLMERVLIPIPPLHVQQEIVRILDKFHTLTTSISEGLPREIELRKQQYAYYRDQLLSFER